MYFIIFGNDGNYFVINFNIGVILVNCELDYEIIVWYFFGVWVSDSVF